MKFIPATANAVMLCLILVIFSIGVVVFELPQEQKHRKEVMEARLDSYTEVVNLYTRNPDCDMDSLCSLLPPNIRLTLIDNSGTVMYDNYMNLFSKVENHAARPEIAAAARTGKGNDIRLSTSTGEKYMYYAKHSDDVYIRVALPYDIQLQHLLKPKGTFLYYLLILLILGIAFIYYKQIIDDYKLLKSSEKKLSLEHEKNIVIKQELTGNIAHELRTPVTGIRGYLETVLNIPLDRAKEREFIGKAYEQIVTLSDLIRDMTLLSKLNESPASFQFQPVVLQNIIDKARTEFNDALQVKDIIIRSSVSKNFCVYGNDNLLYAVFRNLIENVINYAGENVTVQIDNYKQQGKFAYFSFSDNGAGIPDEKHLPRLFERFYRVGEGRTRDTGGSGLGLSIVKNVIAFHGGTISVRNRRGGGLEFLFSLPY
ncbi:MAG: hypothetical protein LBJ17_03100 [Dysgonamonadaceae bacterium]|jgi:signal transduction histidine kinase|nr:hypothetical protein [Dysgonamonadaceae bacterium]